MIDLHCHILPELDDGARSLEDSVAMARQAVDDGIEAVCATPHIRHDHDVHIHEIAPRVAELRRALAEENVAVRILPGGEVAQTAVDSLSDEELRSVSLGGAGAWDAGGCGWILLEPAPGPLADTLIGVVDRLAARGARAIVAHPERHADADFEQRLVALVGRGCLIQWTAEFVATASDDDLVLRYARDGLVHLLGSDSHSSLAGRPVQLRAGFQRLRGVCDPGWVDWMGDIAPRAIVAGNPVSPP
jgi:protein-tyrosine phosphatase